MNGTQSVQASQGGAVAAPQQQSQMAVFKSILNADSIQEQFRNALGEHKDLFIASLIELYSGDKALQTCKPQDVVLQALKAATLDLPINKALGFAYIVVYNNSVKDERGNWVKVPTPTFIPGYRGYIQLAARSGEYAKINADVVYEGELVKANKLTGDIDLSGKRTSDRVVGYFAYIEYRNGFSKTLYMSVEQMASYALNFSPSIKRGTTMEQLIALANEPRQGKGVGWQGNFTDMAKKTVLRQIIGKYGIMSVKMQGSLATAYAADNSLDSAAERNQMIDESANSQTLEIDTAEFEDVDLETGEVTAEATPTAEPAPAPAEEPEY